MLRPAALAASLLLLAGVTPERAAAQAAAGGCPAPAAGGAPADPAGAALARGNTLLLQGDPAGAVEAYAESERQARAGGDAGLALRAAANRLQASVEAGRLDGIEDEVETLARVAGDRDDVAERVRLWIHLGRTSARLADAPGGPRSARAQAAELLQRAADQAQVAGLARDRSYALGYLGGLYAREGHLDDALALTQRAVLAALEADASDALWRWQWQTGRIQRRAGQDEAALANYRSAVGTLGGLRGQAAPPAAWWSSDPEGSVETLYLELVDLLLDAATRAGSAGDEQQLLTEARDSLEAYKAEELRDYFRDECLAAQRKATPDEIPGAWVIYPIAMPDRLEILVGAAGRLRRFTVDVDRERLTRTVNLLRQKLVRRTTREYEPYARQLWEWLIRPIQPVLDPEKIDTLVFVPDGPLRTIPFAALQDPDSGEFLIQRYPLAIVPSLTLTDPRPIESQSVRLLAAGLSEAVAGFPPLEAVEGEIEALHEAFPGQVLMNDGFRVASFVDEVEGNPFGIVHIASHGEFADDPSESFLLTYDGRLSMDRLSNTVGTTRFRQEQPLELLTLSACETAAGNDRAALGLAGIALRAGARSAVATLWSVNDQASAELVVRFYQELSRGGLSRAEALQAAQLGLIEHRGYRHPAFWSAFVLISSWL